MVPVVAMVAMMPYFEVVAGVAGGTNPNRERRECLNEILMVGKSKSAEFLQLIYCSSSTSLH